MVKQTVKEHNGSKSIRHRTAALILAAAVLFCTFGEPHAAADAAGPDLGGYPETYILLAEAGDPYTAVGGMEKNADERAYPASIVKLLTALVALDYCSLSDTVVITEHAVDLSGANTKVGLRVGEVYTLEDLLYASLLPSGCDAARAIADLVAGGEEPFAVLMNEKAAALGMTGSHFTNASGLHDPDQYTTCRDLILLGGACAGSEVLCSILTTKDWTLHEKTTGRKISVRNINRLIRDPNPADYEKIQCIYPYCIGGKTGSTNAAGLTFMAMAYRDGKTLVCVLLGNYTPTAGLKGVPYDQVIAGRFRETVDLFEYGFSVLFPTVTAAQLISNGLPGTFTLTDAETGLSVPARAYTDSAAVSVSTDMLADLSTVGTAVETRISFPVAAGDAVGEVIYSYQGSVFLRLPLVAEEPVALPTPEPTIVPEPEETPIPVSAPARATEVPVQPEETSGGLAMKILLWALILLIAIVALFLILLLSSGKKKGKRRKQH